MSWQFDDETTLTPTGESRFTTELASAWSIGENLNGGYLLAPLLKAMTGISGHPHPLTVTTHFLRPGRGGAAEIEVEPIRSGRTIGTVRGRLSQGGKTKLESIAAFTDLVTEPGLLEIGIEPVDLPPPDECVNRRSLDQGVVLPLMDRVEMRVHPDHAVAGHGGEPEIAGWIRFTDKRPIDPLGLTMFADAFPPPLFSKLGFIGWVPTIELTVHVRRVPVQGWIRGHFKTSETTGNRTIEDGVLWDESGAVVAQARQVGLILQGAPS